MREYASIMYHSEGDIKGLVNHLSMNGYDFGIDERKHLLFVNVDEIDYVETILQDRNILYHVRVY